MSDFAESTAAAAAGSTSDGGRGAHADSSSSEAADTGGVSGQSLIDSIADLLQMTVNYLRQETAGIMRDKVVLPGQRLGAMVAFALAASFLLALGVAFLSVALLLVLAGWLTWPGALGLIGALLVLGAGVSTALKVRSMQR